MDPYAVLGVAKTADAAEIRKAFLRESFKSHPDKNPGDPAAAGRFHDVQTAYRTLSDPSAKYIYDEFGARSKAEITGEAEELDAGEDTLTVDGILSAMQAMGMAADEDRAAAMLANAEFEVDAQTVRQGGLTSEVLRAHDAGVTDLDLSRLVLRRLADADVAAMSLLTSLNLSINSLRGLPAGISTLTRLRRLNLSDNKLRSFPTGVLALTALTALELERNELVEVPPAITALQDLRRLNVFSNRLKRLPPRICFDLPRLSSLDVSCNFLNEQPLPRDGVDLIVDGAAPTAVAPGSLVAQFFAKAARAADKKPTPAARPKKKAAGPVATTIAPLP